MRKKTDRNLVVEMRPDMMDFKEIHLGRMVCDRVVENVIKGLQDVMKLRREEREAKRIQGLRGLRAWERAKHS